MEINFNELYGLTEEEGAKEQDVAEPAEGQPEETGEEEQGVAAPAGEEDPAPADETPAEVGTEEKAEKKTGKKDADFAAARRKAEQERDAAIAANKRQYDEMIAACGFEDPFTGEPVQNMEQLKTFAEAARQERMQNIRDKSGMSEEEFNSMVAELPEVKEAKALAKKAREERAQRAMEEHIAEIGKMDPAIRSIEDLTKDPKFPEIREKVRSTGMNVLDAYRLAYHDDIVRKASERAKESARLSAAGKSHMTQTAAPHGQADSAVPPDVMREYRRYNPTATAEEIHRHWNRMNKK